MLIAVAALAWSALANPPQQEQPWEELVKNPTPALAEAATDPEALWAFLIHPETPYLERMAAGQLGIEVFPPEFGARIALAEAELRDIEFATSFGHERNRMDSRLLIWRPSGHEKREVLGHTWHCPQELREAVGPASIAKAEWPAQAYWAVRNSHTPWIIRNGARDEAWTERYVSSLVAIECGTQRGYNAIWYATKSLHFYEMSPELLLRKWADCGMVKELTKAIIRATSRAEANVAYRELVRYADDGGHVNGLAYILYSVRSCMERLPSELIRAIAENAADESLPLHERLSVHAGHVCGFFLFAEGHNVSTDENAQMNANALKRLVRESGITPMPKLTPWDVHPESTEEINHQLNLFLEWYGENKPTLESLDAPGVPLKKWSRKR